MEAKIKKEWIHYDYSINALFPDQIPKDYEEHTGRKIEYLGKSKAIQDENGKVIHLQTRHLFFKYI